MCAEQLGDGPWLPALHRLDPLKHVDAGFRVVTGFPQVLQAKKVCLSFEVARKMKEGEGCTQLAQCITADASENGNGQSGQIEEFLGTGLPGGVPCSRVAQFVCDDRSQFGLVIRKLQRGRIDVNEAARKCEGSNFFRLDQVERNRKRDVRVPRQILAETIHILGDDGVFHEAGLFPDFFGQLLAEGELLLQTVEVHASANLAASNGIRVALLIRLSSHEGQGHKRDDDDDFFHVFEGIVALFEKVPVKSH